jgi:tol-pal system beta propeller repeat protein TolB
MLYMRALVFPVVAASLATIENPKGSPTSGTGKGPVPLSIAVVPSERGSMDSIRAILHRDFEYSDRLKPVRINLVAEGSSPTPVVKALAGRRVAWALRVERTPDGVRASLYDVATGEVKRSGDFPLVEPVDRSRPIRDSLGRIFNPKHAAARAMIDRATFLLDSLERAFPERASLTREVFVRDSLLRDSLAKASDGPARGKKKEKLSREAAAKASARRDSLNRELARRDSLFRELTRHRSQVSRFSDELRAFRAHARRDSTVHDSTLAVLIGEDAAERLAAQQSYRFRIHAIADQVEEWITGTRGAAGTRILYVQNGQVRMVDFDGANDRALTRPVHALSPAWHPRGTAVTYSTMTESGTRITVLDLETGKTRFVGRSSGMNITPTFTPDGQAVVYASGSEGGSDLYRQSLARNEQSVRLTSGDGFDYVSPIFGPDGRLALFSNKMRYPQIFTMNADGSRLQLATSFVEGKRSYRTSPDWSPDGKTIAFQQQQGDFQIWLLNVRNGQMRRLTTKAENEDPSWSPDGRHLAFTSNRGGTKEIWIMDVRTGKSRQLTRAPGARLAAWSPYLGSAPTTPPMVAALPD